MLVGEFLIAGCNSYLPDGNIEFLGRIDNQVKIRGLRIEPGEIEAVLNTHPQVQQAVVIAREDQAGNKRLVAYIVPHQQSLSSSEMHSFLKQKLPEYMVPAAFVLLEALPLTPNGKVNRRALPAPDGDLSREENFVAPRTPTQEVIANIFASVLCLQHVGIHDNFFNLGGHSLLAVQVISRLRQSFNVELPVRCVFESPTVAQLAQTLAELQKTASALIAPPIEAVPRDGWELPLSFAQERLWFLDQLEGASATYNMPIAMRIAGQVNVTALEQALAEIVRRHEVLRTYFRFVNGSPVQVIDPKTTLTLPVVDLQELPEAERFGEVERLATQEAQTPFDLSQGPLVRARLLQLAPQEHVLLLVMHHIVFDGWSIGVFIQEVTALYPAFSTGAASPLAELPIQYADFAVWQRQWLSGEVLETQLNYWKQQLAAAPLLLELPTDRVRPPVQTFRGQSQAFALNQELSRKLQTLSQNSGTTLFMTLLAAFATLLYRYSGQEDILIGSPIANRNRAQIESLIGFFVNTLVLRTRLEGNPSFAQVLSGVRQVALEAYAHQDVPFERVVEALQPERNLSHSPLFQVMFVLQNAPMGQLQLPGVALTPLSSETVTAKFDLTLSMEETEQGLEGVWEYNSDLFDGKTIARMAGHFQTLLQAIVANPEQPVRQLPLLTEWERHQLLVAWNDTASEYPANKCIHQLFEEQVKRTPKAPAVVFEQQQLTYQELNCRANQLAHHLQRLGVGPEVLVGICVERSLEMVVGLLGILKAGGAYLPLDPAYPEERLAFILEDAQVPVLLVQQQLVDSLPAHQAQVVCLDTDWQVIATRTPENPVSRVNASNLAYVIYTSGSTGKPKGVQIPHRAVVNFLDAMRLCPGLTESDTLNAVTTISFDIAALELYLPLMVGAKVIVVSREIAGDGPRLLRQLLDSGATVMQATPATWQMLLASGWSERHSVKVFCGGEALPAKLADQLLKTGNEVWNLYGPTEATIWSAAYKIGVEQLIANTKDAPVFIGRPIANTQIYILDRHLQPVPIGIPGELHIGGAGLARGYLKRSELTREKFIPNPLSDEPEARLYKTGDLARYLPDRNIEFLGRIDNQVKIRGFRIELGEIEAVLNTHPQVQQAVVIAREDQPGNKRLVAYFVANQQSLSSSQVRQFLLDKLPEYMVPSAFVLLEALPLMPNGKVDRRTLPAPDGDLSWEVDFVAPRDTLELQLTQIWSEVLNVHPVGVRDNFFDLGGHSLLAVRLVAQIHNQFGKNLSLSTLFQGATIENLASILRNQQASSQAWSPLVKIQPAGHQQPFFCIHPVGGNVLCYVDLANRLGVEQPFYGLQSPGLNGEQEPLTRIEDMAAHYIETLRTIQPQGPYQLGGWSLGGIVAFEMAQQLHSAGHQVALLALIDSYAPITINRFEEIDEAMLIADLAKELGGLFGRELLVSVDALQQIRPEEQLDCVLEQAKTINILPPEVELQQMRQLLKVRKANLQAMYRYTPQPYPGQVTLFCASEQTMEVTQDPTRGWSKLAANSIEIYEIPGNHYAILREPHVRVLAERLQSYLEQAQTNDERP